MIKYSLKSLSHEERTNLTNCWQDIYKKTEKCYDDIYQALRWLASDGDELAEEYLEDFDILVQNARIYAKYFNMNPEDEVETEGNHESSNTETNEQQHR